MNTYQIIFLISFLWICGYSVSDSNSGVDLLPRSIIELEEYYEIIENFEKRGISTEEQARQEK